MSRLKHHPHHTADNARMMNASGRYLLVHILRGDVDCSLNGISSPERAKGKSFYAPCPDGNWTLAELEKDETGNKVILEVCPSPLGDGESYFFKERGAPRGMNSGNYVHTSDSRFSAAYGCPIRMHDRYES